MCKEFFQCNNNTGMMFFLPLGYTKGFLVFNSRNISEALFVYWATALMPKSMFWNLKNLI